ncbi:MAG: pyridoxamine 5'-phosphate oxidase [Flavobacteriales bacterium]
MTQDNKRTDFSKDKLLEDEAGIDPIALFDRWYAAANSENVLEPNAMSLATAGSVTISCRIVYLQKFDKHGFVFYTNQNSRKAMDLERDPRAALTFFWPELERQVRIEGKAEHVTAEESDAYFATRPRASRIGAWASDQSRAAGTREEMDDRYKRWVERFGDQDVPRPLHWGGIRVKPVRIEFWQGRADRMHDRIVFELAGEEWIRLRLQP